MKLSNPSMKKFIIGGKMIKFVKAPWFKGEPLQWNSVRFNGGDVYYVYRFGPIMIQVRK